MWLRILSIFVLASFGLAGCGSPEVTFIDLQSREPERTPLVERVAGSPVGVGTVTLPPEIEGTRLVQRTADNRLEVHGNTRWAASLDEQVQRVLALNLAKRVPRDKSILPGEPSPDRMRLFIVVVESFSPGPDADVLLEASWSLVEDESRRTLLERRSEITVPSRSPAPGDIAEAMSTALARLADQMALALEQ